MVSGINGIKIIEGAAPGLPGSLVLLEGDRMQHSWFHSVSRVPRIIPQSPLGELHANPRAPEEKFLRTPVICILIKCHLST